jgi:hypothetical protein
MTSETSSNDISLPSSWKALPALLVAVGAVSLLLSVGLCYLNATPEHKAAGVKFFMHSYLTNYMYCLSFGLGALFFVLVQFLCRAGWSASVRRLAEIMASTLPLMAILFLPILIMVLLTRSTSLYEWNTATPEGLILAKKGFLNGPFFTLRSIVYFLVFIGSAYFVYSNSRRQDETGDTSITLKIQAYSGPLIMLYALAISFASFDWVMSIDADWYSTIFGVIIFAGSMLGFFSLLAISCMLLQRNGKLLNFVTIENYHDIAKFMFGFIMFWAYVSFSQYLLYWYGDIPEETIWYDIRINSGNGWEYVAIALLLVHFVVPFLGLISRHVRRNKTGLFFWACWLLIAHWIDLSFLILPNAGPVEVTYLLGHLLCFIGMVSIFLAMLLLKASNVPLVATRDPRVPEALSYHNIIV